MQIWLEKLVKNYIAIIWPFERNTLRKCKPLTKKNSTYKKGYDCKQNTTISSLAIFIASNELWSLLFGVS